jgi:hypothetical protein
MIDKLEILVPESVPVRSESWRERNIRPAKVGLPYSFTLDVDKQFALRIHFNHRTSVAKDKRHRKVDFTDTRLLSAWDVLWRLTKFFQIKEEQALSLRVARIDFAADVYGVPMEWFKRHCRVKAKRKPQSYETSKVESSKGAVTSLVFGKRPDLYRVYDRVAEKRERGADILYAGMFSGAPTPIVTRVERQCSGKAIPQQLSTLGGLFKHGADADPFPGLICTPTSADGLADDDWSPQKWLMNVGLATVVKEIGEATVRARLNRAGGNARRIFEKYSQLLRSDSPGVTVEQLREVYRNGTIRQLNLPVEELDGVTRYPQGGRTFTL